MRLLAVLGLAAVWAGVSLHFGGPSLWMSLVVTQWKPAARGAEAMATFTTLH